MAGFVPICRLVFTDEVKWRLIVANGVRGLVWNLTWANWAKKHGTNSPVTRRVNL